MVGQLAAMVLGDEQVPEALGPRLRLQLLQDGRLRPARRSRRQFLNEAVFVRIDVGLHEGDELAAQLIGTFGKLGIHCRPRDYGVMTFAERKRRQFAQRNKTRGQPADFTDV